MPRISFNEDLAISQEVRHYLISYVYPEGLCKDRDKIRTFALVSKCICMDRDFERDCIDDKGHRIIYHDFFKQCEKCGFTWWFYYDNNNPTKVDDEKPAQSSCSTPHQKYRD